MQKIYTVRPGDSLSGIARAAQVALDDILALNPQITNANLIQPGQQIVLPESADRSEIIRRHAIETFPGSEPDWFKIASREENAGVREFNNGSNPRIVEYLATCRDLSRQDKGDDGTAWCSAFVNWCLKLAGIAGTDSAGARSWASWGRPDPSPDLGSIVVWRRLKGTEGNLRVVGGHVAFLVEDLGDHLKVLGGNQGDRVCRKTYPRNGYLSDSVSRVRVRNKYELIGFRRP